jgi:hypothetical protein
MDKLERRYTDTLNLSYSKNPELAKLAKISFDDLDEDQMIDLIMWIDMSFEKYSLTNGFQDHPHKFFIPNDELWGISPYQLLQNDPSWWIVQLSNLYNLNFMVFD